MLQINKVNFFSYHLPRWNGEKLKKCEFCEYKIIIYKSTKSLQVSKPLTILCDRWLCDIKHLRAWTCSRSAYSNVIWLYSHLFANLRRFNIVGVDFYYIITIITILFCIVGAIGAVQLYERCLMSQCNISGTRWQLTDFHILRPLIFCCAPKMSYLCRRKWEKLFSGNWKRDLFFHGENTSRPPTRKILSAYEIKKAFFSYWYNKILIRLPFLQFFFSW